MLFEQHKANVAAQTVIPARTVPGSAQYPVSIDRAAATVLVGKPTAKVTVDAYEDFECPICREFESQYFTGVEQQLEAGTVQVRYRMLNLLDQSSVPAGYSTNTRDRRTASPPRRRPVVAAERRPAPAGRVGVT